jgi:propionyl-CoA synthetase
MAATYQALGVGKGDRVLIYMPMVPEALFAMLAAVRLGAIHSVVFGGFASVSLATRIEDASPKLIVSADAGSRGGKPIAYKPLLDKAIELSAHKPAHVLIVNRGLVAPDMTAGRDLDYAEQRDKHWGKPVPCEWVASEHPSYILYTSGTTGKPKGVQRDTGGYAVALAASMKQIFMGAAGDTMFTTSDVGWVVGHSYIVYAPLIAGMATVVYEGLPIRPDAGIWWQLVEKHGVNIMFSAPTAMRILKKEGAEAIQQHKLDSLRALFVAGEPLDETTSAWLQDTLGIPIVDNYWQTESGWPILGTANGVERRQPALGSAGLPMPGYRVRLIDDQSGEVLQGAYQKGVVMIEAPLPPGFMQTVWGDDARFLKTYWQQLGGRHYYSTFDWGIRNEAGDHFILGRTDDVINVAGHRFGTREIEASIATHAAVAESAVVGVADQLKGQIAVAFVTLKDAGQASDALRAEVARTVEQQLGAVARPSQIHFVGGLPKTRSGKVLRRALQAVAEQRDPGDLSTIEDPTTLTAIQGLLKPASVD